MGLTYQIEFKADHSRSAGELADFLRTVEKTAKELGFNPTIVFEATFDTEERRKFARRITSGVRMENPHLVRPKLTESLGIWHHDPIHGICNIAPESAVLLVVRNERGVECALGFYKYPQYIRDESGRAILGTGIGKDWTFRDFIKSGDMRYRKLVKLFSDAQFLAYEKDEYFPAKE